MRYLCWKIMYLEFWNENFKRQVLIDFRNTKLHISKENIIKFGIILHLHHNDLEICGL